jgi:hypothetical protein
MNNIWYAYEAKLTDSNAMATCCPQCIGTLDGVLDDNGICNGCGWR